MKKCYGLDLLRIGLMVWVLLFHARIHYGFSLPFNKMNSLISVGAVSVTGFFMISGFVLRHNYRNRMNTPDQIKHYLVSRFSSVYPMYLFMLLLAVVANYKLPLGGESLIPLHLAMMQVFDEEKYNYYYFNNNVWYVCTAFILYLVFPAINYIFNNFIKRRTMAKLIIILFGLTVCSEYLFYINIYSPVQSQFLEYYCHPLFRIPEFAAGVAFSDLYQILDQKFPSEKSWKNYILLMVSISSLFVGILVLYPYLENKYNMYNIILLPCFGIMLISLCRFRDTTRIVRFAKNRMVEYIASLTFMMYLCQSFPLALTEHFYSSGVSLPMEKLPMLYFAATIAFSVAAHHLIEKPGKKILIHWLGGFSRKEDVSSR